MSCSHATNNNNDDDDEEEDNSINKRVCGEDLQIISVQVTIADGRQAGAARAARRMSEQSACVFSASCSAPGKLLRATAATVPDVPASLQLFGPNTKTP